MTITTSPYPLRRALVYPFADPAWRGKLGVLLLLTLIPGLNVIVYLGYGISIAHNMARGSVRPLPEWAEWGDILARGLMAATASILYLSPALICALVATRTSGLLTPIMVGLAGLCALLGFPMLIAGHLRYARSDQFNDYRVISARLRDVLRAPGVCLRGMLWSILIIITLGITIPVTALTLLGPFVVVTGCCILNGYVMGIAARAIVKR